MSANGRTFRLALLAIALLGLVLGFAVPPIAPHWPSHWFWAAATLPVVLGLMVSIVRDLMMGRVGVDAIALVAMATALLLDQSLAAVVVAIMYAGGNVLEDYARGRAERDLKALTDRTPKIAHRRADGGFEDVPVDRVEVGDALMVRAGEVLPVDGELIDDEALIDESAVTGEAMAERRHPGDLLRSGTINAGESFLMRATADASGSTYAGIVRLVAEAQTAKAPFIRMADRFAILLLPATLILAGAAWFFSGDPVRALAVLVVATPCPLILAAPVAFIGGVSRAARAGVLMKGSVALEALAQVRTAVFDKTGTLTHGGAELLAIDTVPGQDEDEAMHILASLEQASHHVIAENIGRVARSRGLRLSDPVNMVEHRGAGIEGIVDGRYVRAGSRVLVLGDQPLPLWAERHAARYREQPVLNVHLAIDGRLVTIFTFGDSLRGDAREALSRLRDCGVERIVMLTGDDGPTARRIGETLNLDGIEAEASPARKVAVVEAERARATTMMVGDGINDAPALAAAHVGLAMGARGATASSEAADIVVLTDRLKPVADAVRIAQRTRAIARQSIVAGLGLSGAAMVAAAFGYIPPVVGALLQEVIDVAVILNALRALGEAPAARADART